MFAVLHGVIRGLEKSFMEAAPVLNTHTNTQNRRDRKLSWADLIQPS